jgi:hypothetical protein
LNWILDITSWISPFILVKSLVYAIVEPISHNFYVVLDLLFMRPMSWISTMILVEWAISKIPTESAA